MLRKGNERGSRADAVNPKSTVQSLAKGFRVLQAFTAEKPELKLSEVARLAGLDSGTVFRLLETLVMLGYLERETDTKQYRLTLKPLELGFNAIARMDLRTVAQPELRALVGTVHEAASLGILDRDEVVFIERAQGGRDDLGVDIRIGSRVPAYCSAIGHALLAFLPRAEARRILELSRRVKINEQTPVAIDDIEKQLAVVRELGYALSDATYVAGLRVLSAPILDADNYAIAAISVAAPSHRMPLKEFVELTAGPVTTSAARIAHALSAGGMTMRQSIPKSAKKSA
jgi:IclR family transcriptional regulator, pca regulon regulatory protein